MVVKRKPKMLFFVLVLFFVILCCSVIFYFYNLSPVNSKNNEEIEVEIPDGTSTIRIGKILKEKELIKNETVFRIYVITHNVKSMKASNYLFRKNMSLPGRDILSFGPTSYNLSFYALPSGRRDSPIAARFH